MTIYTDPPTEYFEQLWRDLKAADRDLHKAFKALANDICRKVSRLIGPLMIAVEVGARRSRPQHREKFWRHPKRRQLRR